MSPDLISALIGFGGAILGGVVQSAFGWRQAHTQFLRDSRARDYALFAESLAAMSQASTGTPERANAIKLSIEAKAKIILNGSPAVVRALAEHSRHAVLGSEESYKDFCVLVAAMREDLGGLKGSELEPMTRAILFETKAIGR
ncbi:hypothetical protein FHS95_000477 [Sphingomonas naasensis]|uniref:Uncharacterized protein n=1 Tax=Sphingomonas naasensis TaxID=1344951 RepID=A0A4S1WWS5_9SPHN|nr:hypothetical protein [Sphingomonas naasensis]NIJ18808.1 hypothetical protein [Sphingomonas naasensis]TGX46036.1 hypothetical protein E5A74_02355 [Sphingomonas naasensis]